MIPLILGGLTVLGMLGTKRNPRRRRRGRNPAGRCSICGRPHVDAMTLGSTPVDKTLCYRAETGSDPRCKARKGKKRRNPVDWKAEASRQADRLIADLGPRAALDHAYARKRQATLDQQIRLWSDVEELIKDRANLRTQREKEEQARTNPSLSTQLRKRLMEWRSPDYPAIKALAQAKYPATEANDALRQLMQQYERPGLKAGDIAHLAKTILMVERETGVLSNNPGKRLFTVETLAPGAYRVRMHVGRFDGSTLPSAFRSTREATIEGARAVIASYRHKSGATEAQYDQALRMLSRMGTRYNPPRRRRRGGTVTPAGAAARLAQWRWHHNPRSVIDPITKRRVRVKAGRMLAGGTARRRRGGVAGVRGADGVWRRPNPTWDIKPGDSVTIRTPHGQQRTGRVVMRGIDGWVLNLGGRSGTPGLATLDNIVSVRHGKRRGPTVLG